MPQASKALAQWVAQVSRAIDTVVGDGVADNQIHPVLGCAGPRSANVGDPAWVLSRSPPQDGRCRSQAARVLRLGGESHAGRNTLLNQ